MADRIEGEAQAPHHIDADRSRNRVTVYTEHVDDAYEPDARLLFTVDGTKSLFHSEVRMSFGDGKGGAVIHRMELDYDSTMQAAIYLMQCARRMVQP